MDSYGIYIDNNGNEYTEHEVHSYLDTLFANLLHMYEIILIVDSDIEFKKIIRNFALKYNLKIREIDSDRFTKEETFNIVSRFNHRRAILFNGKNRYDLFTIQSLCNPRGIEIFFINTEYEEKHGIQKDK